MWPLAVRRRQNEQMGELGCNDDSSAVQNEKKKKPTSSVFPLIWPLLSHYIPMIFHPCYQISLLLCSFILQSRLIAQQGSFRFWHTYIYTDCISSKSPKTFQFSYRLISAVSWQRSTPTSRFRVCTTWRGWTCTPNTIWGSSLRTSLPSPMSATVASGNATTASVSSSG